MATDAETPAEGAPSPLRCGPCHGTGRVQSNLGGSPHEVRCPWCEGGGTFIPGHDAQASGAAADSGA
jgi:DnaJ-class molecular chaperone